MQTFQVLNVLKCRLTSRNSTKQNVVHQRNLSFVFSSGVVAQRVFDDCCNNADLQPLPEINFIQRGAIPLRAVLSCNLAVCFSRFQSRHTAAE